MSVPFYRDETLTLLAGDAAEQLRTLPDGCVNCVVTSPPYYKARSYTDHPNEVGAESTPNDFVARLVSIFAEVRRVLADNGTVWLNLGDSYSIGNGTVQNNNTPNAYRDGTQDTSNESISATLKPLRQNSGLPAKNMLGIPWRVALALQADGWYLRNAVIWFKNNAMPDSVRDRLSTRYEHLFLLSKSRHYWFDLDPIRRTSVTSDRGANPGDMWSINNVPFPDSHFSTFPLELPRRCIMAGCKPGGTVLDPFSGAGTTALAAGQLKRKAIGIDLNSDYHEMALKRLMAEWPTN